MAVCAHNFAPKSTSLWYWPSVLIGGLGDLFVGLMVWFVTALTLSKIVIYPHPPVGYRSLYSGLWGVELALFFAITAAAAVGYRWLRMRWTTLSRRSVVTIGVCLALAVLLHFIAIEHGNALLGMPGDPPPPGAWFAWFGERHYQVTGQTFAPRLASLPFGGALSFALGIVAPPVLFGIAMSVLFRAVKRGQGGSSETIT